MSKKKLGIVLIAIGALIVIVTLLSGLVGFPKKGFGYAKILVGIFGLLIGMAGAIFAFIKEGSLRKFWEIVRPHSRQEFILISLGLLIGLLFSIFIPYGAGFDEETHTIRTVAISQLNFIPNQGNAKTLWQLYDYSYQRRNFQTPAFDQFKKGILLAAPDWGYGSGSTYSTYFPANFILPAAIAAIFLLGLHFPLLPTIILMRLVGFIFYLAACTLTLRILPTGKWIFLVLAFTPMALFQAATINGDSFTIACSILFIGVFLKIFLKPEKSMGAKEAWLIALVSVLIGMTKSGTILLLLTLFLFLRFKAENKAVPFIIVSGALVSLIVSIGWMTSNVVNANLWANPRTYTGQLKLVLSNFPDFVSIYIKGIYLSLNQYYTGWVGVYGYWVGEVPAAVYLLFPLALLAAFLSEAKYPDFHKKHRLIILLISIICLVGIDSYEYIGGYVPGVQMTSKVGRIFLPFSPLLLLAFSGWLSNGARLRKISQIVCVGLCAIAVGAYSYGLYLTYYTDCVYQVTPSRPCTLPVYKNIDVLNPYLAEVNDNIYVLQSFKPECSNISSVIVRVETSAGGPADNLVFSVLDENKNVLASNEFSIPAMKQRDLLRLPVQAGVSGGHPTLWISVSIPAGDSSSAAVGLLGRQNGSIYPDGELFFNQEPQDGDLFFQYTCMNK
ncbi:MAG TPA: DUF2142 domain-containing protein [Anaerolineales bacterium]|nr:DUF2142 domain-containing protein [Anaerolineales bacterium]